MTKKEPLTLEDMNKWLNGKTFGLGRKIEIQGHCHGVRVTLHEDFASLSFSIKEDILEAFEECIENLPLYKFNTLKYEVEKERERIREEEQELNNRKSKFERTKEELKKVAKQVEEKKKEQDRQAKLKRKRENEARAREKTRELEAHLVNKGF